MYRRSVTWSIVLLILFLTSCGMMDPCGNEIITRVPSPGGMHEAVVFERACGATTGWSTQIAVVRWGFPILETSTLWRETQAGNVLVIDGRATRGDVYGTLVTPTWTNDTHLVIAYDAGAVVRSLAEVVDGVTIERRAVEPEWLKGERGASGALNEHEKNSWCHLQD